MKGAKVAGSAADPDVRSLEASPRDLLALYSAPTLHRFIEQAFRILPRLVPCDYVSALHQRAGAGFLKERDSRGRVWSSAFMRRYVKLTPAVPLVLSKPGIKVLATRSAILASDSELHQTAFYREVMQPQGWRHGAVLCFWPEPPHAFPILVLSLYRTAGKPDFSDGELAALEDLHPFFAPAVNRLHEISSSRAVSEGIASTLRHVSRGIVVLDWRLRVVRTNLAGRRSCAAWGGYSGDGHVQGPAGPLQVPAAVLAACEELRRDLQALMRRNRNSVAQCRREVNSPEGGGASAVVTVICQSSGMAEPGFVIEFENRVRAPERPAGVALLLSCLTQAEREVAVVVAEGLSNEEAAERLGKSIHAVKFLLHRIYAKLHVGSRARLTLLLHGGADS